MGIPEELKSLEEMNTKGTLTNEEFAAAKAAAISKYGQSASTQPASKTPEPPEKKSTAGRVPLFVFILVVLGVWYAAQHNVSGTTTSAALKAAARMPVDLTNEVENLPASSWRAVPIQLPKTEVRRDASLALWWLLRGEGHNISTHGAAQPRHVPRRATRQHSRHLILLCLRCVSEGTHRTLATLSFPCCLNPNQYATEQYSGQKRCFSAHCRMAESHRVPYGALSVVRLSACGIRKTLS